MNLIDKCTNKEIELVKNAGINIENKDYSDEELKKLKEKFQNIL